MRGSAAIQISGLGYCTDGQPTSPAYCEGGNVNTAILSHGAGLSNVTINQVSIDSASYGMLLIGGTFGNGTDNAGWTGNNYAINNPIVQNSGVAGIWVAKVNGGGIYNSTVTHSGVEGSWSGTIGMDISGTRNLTVQGGEASHTVSPNRADEDGGAIALDGGNENLTITGLKIYSNDAYAFLVDGDNKLPASGGTANISFEISNNNIWDNARKDDWWGVRRYEMFILSNQNLPARGVIKNNRIAWQTASPLRHLNQVIGADMVPVYKEDLAVSSAPPFPPAYFFCGNVDTSINAVTPPLIPGNNVCP
jgi:hypothetical protein